MHLEVLIRKNLELTCKFISQKTKARGPLTGLPLLGITEIIF